jgi:photosystem II stability/assembly factor-like uncharacterized protein
MFLYLFPIWFVSIFSTPRPIVESTSVTSTCCKSTFSTDSTRYVNSANSAHSDSEPFYCLQKNVLIATSDGGDTWKDYTGNFPSTFTPSCFWITQSGWLLGAAEGLYIGNQGIPSTKWEQDELVPKDITYFVTGKKGLYLVSNWNGIYQKQSSGLWTKVSGLINNRPFFSFAEASNGNLISGSENGINMSSDHGKTWKKVYENVGINMVDEVNGVLYACSLRGLLSSKDGGEHWEVSLPGNTAVFRTRSIDAGIVALIEGQQFQGVRSPNEIMLSKDQGMTWNPLFASMPKELKNIYDFVQVGTFYFAATNTGIFKSADHGATWVKTVSVPQDKGAFFKLIVEGETLFLLQTPGC